MKKQLFLTAAVCAVLPYHASFATDPIKLPEVISEGVVQSPERFVLEFEEDNVFPAADGGAVLQSVPGVSGSRMGSHGIDPTIRGQKQGQLNIIDDGVFVHGGCPNRMDPPSAFLSLEGNDELVVEKGYSSVQNGPGGAGGTVRTKRNAPVFEEGQTSKFSVSGGYDGNGDARDILAKTAVSFDEDTYVRANLEKKKARSYEDGSGRDVRAGYSNQGGRIDFGTSPVQGTDITFGVQMDDTRDALFAGAGMDSPEATLFALRSSVEHKTDLGMFDTLKGSAYFSHVDHVMDNFSLRGISTGMGMLTASDTQIVGGKITAENKDTVVGVDLKASSLNALRYMGAVSNIYNSGNEHAYMWPGMDMNEIGLFAEQDYQLSDAGKVKVGLRYDYVHVDASKVNTVSARTGRSANEVYEMYYGYGWETKSEHNVGGLIRYDHNINQNLSFYGGLSRTVRTADASERGMAADHATAASRWVGNPNIDPEQHHQIEIGSGLTYETWNLSGSAYYNKVSDYILRDLARGQDGILLSDGADIYRNVDATLMGFEVAGGVEITDAISLTTNVAYTRGENDEDNRNLAQIAPLEFGATVEYNAADWMSGLRLRGAAKQTRADIESNNNSGLDTGETGGYAVLDLYGKVWAFEPFEVSLGVTNVFDKTYANHLNRSSSFDSEVSQVNEPGRSFFIRINADF